jgi:hypothetical protein
VRSLEKFYIVGAEQKNKVLKDWEQYKKGLILKVCPENNMAEKCLEYRSPSEVCTEENPSILFSAGTIHNNLLYVGTQTEILVYTLPDFKQVHYLSLPCFNDIHHVCPTAEGNLLVVNTGLDTVLEVSFTGEILNEWNVLGGNTWERFSPEIDYRKVASTKPHQSHPNYVFKLKDDIWVTRCLQKDAICLTNFNKRIDIGRALVHDGVVFEDSLYFTQVDGHVVKVDLQNHEAKQTYNLNNMTNTNNPLGWCRGIKVLNSEQVVVGFTRIRPVRKTAPDGKVFWEGEYGVLPTRIACYDLKNEKLLWEQQLEEYHMNAIYSIHSATE